MAYLINLQNQKKPAKFSKIYSKGWRMGLLSFFHCFVSKREKSNNKLTNPNMWKRRLLINTIFILSKVLKIRVVAAWFSTFLVSDIMTKTILAKILFFFRWEIFLRIQWTLESLEKLWFAKMICPSKVCSDNFPNEIWHCCALWACKLAATSFNARCKNRTKVGSSRCPSLVWSYNKGRAAKNLGPNVILLLKFPLSWIWLFPATHVADGLP